MKRLQKRFLDFFFSLVAVVVLSPLLIGLALMVWIRIGRPILFRQQRPGLHGKPFNMLKFRTMRDAIGPDGQPLPDSERLLPFGKFLRSTSLDELPGVFNILKGDMSFVGPRPLLMRYLPFYSYDERFRFEARPGITGLAQIRGRNNLAWADRIDSDLEYVRNYSLSLDIWICWQSFKKVVTRSDIVIDPSCSMQDLDVERSDFLKVVDLSGDDLVLAGEIIKAGLDADYYLGTVVSATNFPDFFAEISSAGSRVLGLYRGADLSGVAQVVETGECIHLNYFVLVESERGWGASSYFLRSINKVFAGQDIALHVDSRNLVATKFYAHFGFKEMERLKYFMMESSGGMDLSSLAVEKPEQYSRFGISHFRVEGELVGLIDDRYISINERNSVSVVDVCFGIRSGMCIRIPSQLAGHRSEPVRDSFDVLLMKLTAHE